jgi:outer membrane protein OmpA-like peptidoglycan-associated protein
MNLGNDINSAHIESSPYLAADNETLYFSSKGFSGYGGSDVYISRRLDDTWTNWTEPENLGPDINSTGDDVFFNIPPSGQYAYYSKSQEEGNGDIYKIEMPVFYQPAPVVSVSGKVVDSNSKQPVAAKISYDLLPENSNVGFVMSDSITGEYEILLPAGSTYNFKAEADGYKSLNSSIDLLDETDFVEIKRTIELSTGEDEPVVAIVDSPEHEKIEEFISGGSKELIVTSSILFEFASDYLEESSFVVLDKIATYMKNNKELQLIIEGHTDNVGPSQYNLSLSKRRAQSVEAYLIAQGIDKSRFEAKGYGMQQPVASNDTKEGQRLNRRVVFAIKE